MDVTIAVEDHIDDYDRLADVLETNRVAVLQTSDGTQVPLPSEVLQVLQQAAYLLARGKALLVTPQSCARFS